MWGCCPVRGVRRSGGFGIQILIGLLICTGALRAQNCVAPPPGLVSWWPGNGDANDLLGGNPGTITTQFLGQVLFSEGKVGTAFDFRGANFVEIPSIPMNSFTLEFWLNQRTRGTEPVMGSILVSGEVCGNVDDWGVSILPDGRLRVLVGDAVQGTTSYPTSFSSIPLNTFTHVAVTRNTSNNEIKIFINGVLDSPHISPHNRVLGTMNPTCDIDLHQNRIGIGNLRRQAVLRGNLQAFDGLIDEISLFNRPLAGVEIGAIFRAGNAGKCPPVSEPQCVPAPDGLVGWWKGDGGTTDAIGSNKGALVGNASFAPGVVGQAFSFDGYNDSVMIGKAPALQLQNFTIEAWIKRANMTQASLDVFTVGHIFGYGYGGYIFSLLDDGRLTLGQVGISGVKSTLSIRDTDLDHVGVSKASGAVAFYVDGVSEAAPQYNPDFYFISSVQIGASQWDGTRPTGSFLGLIDEVSVYNRGLTASEVQSIYLANSFGKCPPASVGPFTNGSFELPPLDTGASVELLAGSRFLTDWLVGDTGLVSWRNGPAYGVAPVDGAQEIGFNGGDTPVGGSISQTFITTFGQTYQ